MFQDLLLFHESKTGNLFICLSNKSQSKPTSHESEMRNPLLLLSKMIVPSQFIINLLLYQNIVFVLNADLDDYAHLLI